MFKFDDLDGMSRLVMLKKQKETKEYWRHVYRLKGAFLAWGSKTSELLHYYKQVGADSDLSKSLDSVAIRGEITVTKLSNQIKKIDAYLMDIDTRLGDGTKWNTAQEIAKILEETEGA